jgi:hypothetical protein
MSPLQGLVLEIFIRCCKHPWEMLYFPGGRCDYGQLGLGYKTMTKREDLKCFPNAFPSPWQMRIWLRLAALLISALERIIPWPSPLLAVCSLGVLATMDARETIPM